MDFKHYKYGLIWYYMCDRDCDYAIIKDYVLLTGVLAHSNGEGFLRANLHHQQLRS